MFYEFISGDDPLSLYDAEFLHLTEMELRKYMTRSLSSADILQEFRLRTRKNAQVILDADYEHFNQFVFNYPAIMDKFIIDRYEPIQTKS